MEVCPWLAPAHVSRSMTTVEAWREGRLVDGARDAVVAASIPLFKPTPLTELARVPISAWQNFVGHLVAQLVNALTFSRQPGDELEQHSLQLIGKVGCSDPAVIVCMCPCGLQSSPSLHQGLLRELLLTACFIPSLEHPHPSIIGLTCPNAAQATGRPVTS